MKIKELTLLEEAKLRYPTGTKIISVLGTTGVIKDGLRFGYNFKDSIFTNDGSLEIYDNGIWAEIVDDFVLPEKWCIKQNTAKEVCDWFNNNGTHTAYINGGWTYLNYPDINGYYSNEINPGCTEITFEQFKKYVLKEEAAVEKDYEILEVKGKYGAVSSYIEELDCDLKDKTIFKVKRISDSEIFTIGDKVIGYNNSIAKIKTIDLVGEVSLNIGTDKHEGFSLKNIKKAKQPLFTTEDGIDIFNGVRFWNVNIIFNLDEFQVTNDKYPLKFIKDGSKQFSTREKAEEYILMNKPLLSLSDVWDNLKVKDQKEVMKFVKSKLNK